MPAERTSSPQAAPLFVVGAGRVGAALAAGLARAGRPPLGLWSRGRESADRAAALTGLPCAHGPLPDAIGAARVILIAVQDVAVGPVAGALVDGGLLRGARVVLHCGGGRPAAEALAGLGSLVARGTFHPLLAVASAEEGAVRLRGTCFTIEGDEAAREEGRALAATLGGQVLELAAGQLPLYHAAAVIASNHAVALWGAAEGLLQGLGLERGQATAALLPLLRSTLDNLARGGAAAALTGPVRRGDPATIAAHLAVLEARAPQLVPLYRAATVAAVGLARQLDDPALAAGLEEILRLVTPGA